MANLSGGRSVAAGTQITLAGGLGLHWPARAAGGVPLAGAGVLRLAALAMRCAAGGLPASGRHLTIRPALRPVALSALSAGDGPGETAGRLPGALPVVWGQINLPADYIGPWLAMLALASGAVWAWNAGQITVAGRVVIDATGGDVVAASLDAAGRWVAGRMALAADCVGIMALPAGPARDKALSSRRDAAFVQAKKAAKAVPKVADAARRRAMVADISFSLRAV